MNRRNEKSEKEDEWIIKEPRPHYLSIMLYVRPSGLNTIAWHISSATVPQTELYLYYHNYRFLRLRLNSRWLGVILASPGLCLINCVWCSDCCTACFTVLFIQLKNDYRSDFGRRYCKTRLKALTDARASSRSTFRLFSTDSLFSSHRSILSCAPFTQRAVSENSSFFALFVESFVAVVPECFWPPIV